MLNAKTGVGRGGRKRSVRPSVVSPGSASPTRPRIGPPSRVPPAESLAEVQARAVLRTLDDQPSLGKIVQIAGEATERVTQAIEMRNAAHVEPACGKGCSFCCHLVNIAVAVPEVVAIAEHLKQNATTDQLDGVRRRIDRHTERMRGTTHEQRYAMRHPCPLLVDDCCMVYVVRPLACRGWNSLDASKCEEDFLHPERNVETHVSPFALDHATQVRCGMYSGLRRAGLKHDRVPFIPALKRALDRPDALQHWLNGASFMDPDANG